MSADQFEMIAIRPLLIGDARVLPRSRFRAEPFAVAELLRSGQARLANESDLMNLRAALHWPANKASEQ